MADWDVVGSVPAGSGGTTPATPQAQDPWAVVTTAKSNPQAEGFFDKTLARLRSVGGEAAAIADFLMPSALANMVVRTGAQLGGGVMGAVFGEDPLKAARSTGEAYDKKLSQIPVLRTAPAPIKALLDSFKSGEAYEQAMTTQGMEKLATKIDEAGVWIEQATGGRIVREAVPLFFETLMTGAAGIGSGLTAKGRAKLRSEDPAQGGIAPWQQKVLREHATKMRDAQELAAADAAPLTPEEQIVRAPVQMQINDMLGIRTPQEQAKITRQRRKEVMETFGTKGPTEEALPPEVAARGTREYGDAGESIFRADERMAQEKLSGMQRILGALNDPKVKVGQAEMLEILQKPLAERTADDVAVLKKAQRGEATQEGMLLAGAVGGGAGLGALASDDELKGASLGSLTGLALVAPHMVFRGESVSGGKGQRGAVKAPGGMWHPEAVERLARPLKENLFAGDLGEFAQRIADNPIYGGQGLRGRLPGDKPSTDVWADKAIKRYLDRYAGTEKDPLKDVEIPFGEGTKRWENLWDSAIRGRRASDTQASRWDTGLEKVPANETVWDVGKQLSITREMSPTKAESHIRDYLSHVGDYLRQNVDPAKLQQYDLVRAVRETFENDKRVAKEMEKAAAASTKDLPVYKDYGDGFKWVELKLPEKLTEEQAKGVKKFTDEKAKAKFAKEHGYDLEEILPDMEYVAVDSKGKPIVNSYTMQEAFGATPEFAFLAGRLAEEGNQMGHCVGGYCAGVASGESRIFSLRDAKGQSHVTIETRPDQISTIFNHLDVAKREVFERALNDNGITYDFHQQSWMDSHGDLPASSKVQAAAEEAGLKLSAEDRRSLMPAIEQIKGKQNRAPDAKYLPYVQDFVKSGKWGEVGDLGNTGLRDISVSKFNSREYKTLAEELFPGQRFLSDKDFQKLQDEGVNRTLTEGNRLLGRNERGAIDQKLVVGLGTLGLGGLIGSQWTEDPVNGAVLGTLATGILGLAATKGILREAGRAIEYTGGLISTRIKNTSPELHQRMLTAEMRTLDQTHKELNKTIQWLKESTNLPTTKRAALDTALFMKDTNALTELNKGNPALVSGWREVRNVLTDLGQRAQSLGRFKDLLDDYFPQRVKDHKGLLEALGVQERTRLELKLREAEREATRRGASLTDTERDAIINRQLRARYETLSYQPGYSKQRQIEQVTKELQEFYYTPQEALAITISEITKDLEMAKLFGRELVNRKSQGRSYIDVEASIGNIIGRELKEGRITPDEVRELEGILKSRYGPGERAAARPLQAIQNLGYAGLLADIPSAAVQLGDPALSVYAHGLRPTIVALARKISGKSKITADDLALMDHIAEDLAFGSTQTGSTRARTRMAVGAGALTGGAAGALLQDDALGAVPGAAAGAFIGYAATVGTAAALNRVLKQGLFAPIDRFGKDIQLGAAHDKLTRWSQTAEGMKNLEANYGEAFGREFPQLAQDLKTGQLTERVRSALFAELSRTQPISKLEAPQALLDHPNARVVYMLKRFMLKQIDLMRREAFGEMAKGAGKSEDEALKHVAKGMKNLTEFGLVLGLSGATAAMVQDFFLGRPVKFETSDVLENMLKTFGLSRYLMDKVSQGQWGPVQAVASVAMPPWMMMERIITADPKAVQYIPVIGQLYYNWELGGREEREIQERNRAKKEGREVELSSRAERLLEKRREERREKKERER